MTIGEYIQLLFLGFICGLCVGLAFSLMAHTFYTWLKLVERG